MPQADKEEIDLSKTNMFFVHFETCFTSFSLPKNNKDHAKYLWSQVYSEPSQTSKMKLFAKIVNGLYFCKTLYVSTEFYILSYMLDLFSENSERNMVHEYGCANKWRANKLQKNNGIKSFSSKGLFLKNDFFQEPLRRRIFSLAYFYHINIFISG